MTLPSSSQACALRSVPNAIFAGSFKAIISQNENVSCGSFVEMATFNSACIQRTIGNCSCHTNRPSNAAVDMPRLTLTAHRKVSGRRRIRHRTNHTGCAATQSLYGQWCIFWLPSLTHSGRVVSVPQTRAWIRPRLAITMGREAEVAFFSQANQPRCFSRTPGILNPIDNSHSPKTNKSTRSAFFMCSVTALTTGTRPKRAGGPSLIKLHLENQCAEPKQALDLFPIHIQPKKQLHT
jgi:hypothetical protein